MLLKTPHFDIVVPVYNASNRIELLLNAIQEEIKQSKVHVILVDDFSSDQTGNKIVEIQANYSFEISLIQLARNYGQHNATAIGLGYSKGEFTITIDDDLQHHPNQIKELISLYNETEPDLIYGTYIEKKHSILRNIGSFLLQQIVRISNPKLHKITSFRLIKNESIQGFRQFNGPIVFLDEHLINFAKTVEYKEISHLNSIAESNYSYRKLIRFALNIILFHSSLPLQMITRLGLIMSFTFMAIGCFFIWQKLFNDVQLGFTSLIVSIFFSSGLILFALGIIGEYIRKIWVEQQHLNSIVIRKYDTFER